MCASGEQEMIESFAEGEALGFRPAPREGEREILFFLSEMSVFVFPEFLEISAY